LSSEEIKPTGTEFYAYLSRVKKVAAVAGVLGGIAGAAFVVFHLVMADKPSLRGVFIFPFASAFAFSSMLTGVVLLFAPTAFYASEKGQEYLAAIGTTNVKTARFVLVIALTVGCVFFALLGTLALQMMGFIMLPGSSGRFN
jgi:hypothetical protein